MGKIRDIPTMPAGKGEDFGSYKKLMKQLMMFDLKIDKANAASPVLAEMVAMERGGAQLKERMLMR